MQKSKMRLFIIDVLMFALISKYRRKHVFNDHRKAANVLTVEWKLHCIMIFGDDF